MKQQQELWCLMCGIFWCKNIRLAITWVHPLLAHVYWCSIPVSKKYETDIWNNNNDNNSFRNAITSWCILSWYMHIDLLFLSTKIWYTTTTTTTVLLAVWEFKLQQLYGASVSSGTCILNLFPLAANQKIWSNNNKICAAVCCVGSLGAGNTWWILCASSPGTCMLILLLPTQKYETATRTGLLAVWDLVGHWCIIFWCTCWFYSYQQKPTNNNRSEN